MALSLSSPFSYPLTLQEMKLFLRIDNTEEDSLLIQLLHAACDLAEHYTRSSILLRTWQLCPAPSSFYDLPYGPIHSIIACSISHLEQSHVLPETAWKLVQNRLYLTFSLPVDVVCITYQAGYEVLPSGLRFALQSHVAHLFEHRTADTPLPENIRCLYDPYKIITL